MARPTRRELTQADLFEYIEVFYNRSRRHSTLDFTARRSGSLRSGSASTAISNPRRYEMAHWKAKFDGHLMGQVHRCNRMLANG